MRRGQVPGPQAGGSSGGRGSPLAEVPTRTSRCCFSHGRRRMLEACPSVLSPQAKATVPVTTTDPESRRFSEGDSTDPRTRAGPRRRPTPREARPGAAEGHPAFAEDALGDATRPQRVVGLPPPPLTPGTPVPQPHSPGGGSPLRPRRRPRPPVPGRARRRRRAGTALPAARRGL